MRLSAGYSFLFLGLFTALSAFSGPGLPETEPGLSYQIEVRLDPENHTLQGRQTLVYENRSSDFIPNLEFHLYLNAFSGYHSNFSAEHPYWLPRSDQHLGFIKVTDIQVEGTPVDPYFVRKESSRPMDRTVMGVDLPNMLFPGEKVTVTMAFEARLPKSGVRTGWADRTHVVAQWFPKLGVWQSSADGFSGWFCPPFHYNTEFFADFATYQVSITAPDDQLIAATGVRTSESQGEGEKTTVFHADWVHDFAWVADQGATRHSRIFSFNTLLNQEDRDYLQRTFQLDPATLEQQDVEVELILQENHAHQEDRHYEAAFFALKRLVMMLGNYPYPKLTLVDPPDSGFGLGGMEYPTFVLLRSDPRLAAGSTGLEEVIIHEVVHQYWYGMVGFNEMREPWLDEGLTQYTSDRIFDDMVGYIDVHRALFGYEPSVPVTRLLMLPRYRNPEKEREAALGGTWYSFNALPPYLTSPPNSRYSRRLRVQPRPRVQEPPLFWGSKGLSAYRIPYLTYATMERVLGRETWDRGLRDFFNRYRFQHPTTKELVEALDEVSGKQTGPWFEAMWGEPVHVNYRVRDIDFFEAKPGLHLEEFDPDTIAKITEQGGLAMIELQRDGHTALPVDVRVHFEDDTIEDFVWQARAARRVFYFPGKPKVKSVLIDPEFKILFDEIRADNSRVAEPPVVDALTGSSRYLRSQIQHIMQLLAGGL